MTPLLRYVELNEIDDEQIQKMKRIIQDIINVTKSKVLFCCAEKCETHTVKDPRHNTWNPAFQQCASCKQLFCKNHLINCCEGTTCLRCPICWDKGKCSCRANQIKREVEDIWKSVDEKNKNK
jgi:hypothetical protein